MTPGLFNNIGTSVLAISFTAQEFGAPIPIAKALLATPLVTHKTLLNYLARKNAAVLSIEQLIVSRTECFANFNSRYYAGLCDSVNAIQFLVDVELAELKDNALWVSNLQYDSTMGKRAQKIWKAASRIAVLLQAPASQLYSSLRIRL